MSDRIAIMQDGRIIQIGTPAEIYSAPANRFVASFMGEVNLLTIEHTAEGGANLRRNRPTRRKPKGAYAMIRPEALATWAGRSQCAAYGHSAPDAGIADAGSSGVGQAARR